MGYFSHQFVWLPSLLKLIGRWDQERKKLIMVCVDDGRKKQRREGTKKTQPNYGILLFFWIIVGRECFVYITIQVWPFHVPTTTNSVAPPFSFFSSCCCCNHGIRLDINEKIFFLVFFTSAIIVGTLEDCIRKVPLPSIPIDRVLLAGFDDHSQFLPLAMIVM